MCYLKLVVILHVSTSAVHHVLASAATDVLNEDISNCQTRINHVTS